MSLIATDLNNISFEPWNREEFRQKKLRVEVLRLDKIHPDISGNKWFKLKHFVEYAKRNNKRRLLSFGGPYSNHILALAATSKMNGIESIGYIRGEEPLTLTHTLIKAKEYGMELRFLSRSEYDFKKNAIQLETTDLEMRDTVIIPEGGASVKGIMGAEEILSTISISHYSHICCAVGTGVTLAGLVNGAESHQIKIGVTVLKGTSGLEPLNINWIKNQAGISKVHLVHSDHFGGYAKKTPVLINFMNQVYGESGIPTDFVYTAKLFYSISRLAKENTFPSGSHILIVHTGGLQGNHSLSSGLLQF